MLFTVWLLITGCLLWIISTNISTSLQPSWGPVNSIPARVYTVVNMEEWREHQRQHNLKRVTLNGPRLAEFLSELEKDEAWQLQRQRDLEEQPQREALLGPWSQAVVAIQEPEQAPIEVDLSTLPTYEVYH